MHPLSIDTTVLLNRGVDTILPSVKTLAAAMGQRKLRVYIGVDPTGSFLTLGHSIGLRKLQQFANAGHEAILLVGNGTVKIGDPTGRDESRPMLTDEVIQANFRDWQKQAAAILDFDTIQIRYNSDWLEKLSYIDMVKLLATTTVQQLIERDMFQQRIQAGKPIHGHEIIYPLLQGYDSVAMDVDLEIGGTDQTFNMLMGRSLQKQFHNKEKWVLTVPIITGLDGRKMSKSYHNYIALTETPIDMYGKLMRIGDDQIIPYFELLTDVTEQAIAEVAASLTAGDNPMTAKKYLAHTITVLYHGQLAADQAQKYFEHTVQQKAAPEELVTLTVSPSELSLLALTKQALPTESGSALTRLIQQGGVQLNQQKIIDPQQLVHIETGMILKVGKREFFRLSA